MQLQDNLHLAARKGTFWPLHQDFILSRCLNRLSGQRSNLGGKKAEGTVFKELYIRVLNHGTNFWADQTVSSSPFQNSAMKNWKTLYKSYVGSVSFSFFRNSKVAYLNILTKSVREADSNFLCNNFCIMKLL